MSVKVAYASFGRVLVPQCSIHIIPYYNPIRIVLARVCNDYLINLDEIIDLAVTKSSAVRVGILHSAP